jgi:hypothetical protein
MTPTVFGLLVAVLGTALMWRSVTAMLCLVIVCTLLGAASAIDVPALGGSSIQPAHMALGFLLIRLAFSPHARLNRVAAALRANQWFVLYASYGVVAAFMMPRLFAGAINLVPMKITTTLIYATVPLRFGPQNITTAVYLIGTCVMALAVTLVVQSERRTDLIVRACIGVAWLHIAMGMADLALAAVGHADLLNVLRNASYSQLSQEVAGARRISGSFPETSAYSLFAFNWLVLMTELRLRGVKPFWTALTAVVLAGLLLLTTSSTAYLGLGAYGLVLLVRAFFTPMRPPAGMFLMLFAFILICASAVIGFIVIKPHAWTEAVNIVQRMTTEKIGSRSGIQRALWAKQGLDAFLATYGLGAGPGSFRSSSLATAIIGSSGIIGVIAFLMHLFVVLRPLSVRTHDLHVRGNEAVGRAAAWTIVVALIPSSFMLPSPDPGLLFAIFSGIALGSRTAPRAVPEEGVATRRAPRPPRPMVMPGRRTARDRA